MCTVMITYDDNFDAINSLIEKIKGYGATVVREDATDYDPEFVAKLQRGMEDHKMGKCVKVAVEDLWKQNLLPTH